MTIQNQTFYLVLIYGITAFGVLASVITRDFFKMDFSKVPLINFEYKIGYGVFNMWCVTHLIMYTFLGFFAPSLWYISISLSILWESFEYIIEKHKITRFIDYNTNDLLINTFGLIIGVTANSIWNKYKKTKDKSEDEEKPQDNKPKTLKKNQKNQNN